MNGAVLIAKFKQYPVAIIGFAAALILAVAVFLRSGSIPELESRKAALETQVTRIDTNTRNASNLPTHLERIKEKEEQLKGRLFVPTQIAQNQLYFFNLEQQSDVRLTLANTRRLPAQSKNIEGLTTIKSYGVTSIDMTVAGDFPNVLDYINRLGSGRLITRISALSIGRGQGPQASHTEAKISLEILATP